MSTLAWLLNPAGSHDLGDAFLMRFMHVVATAADASAVLAKIALSPDAAVRIRREVPTADLRRPRDSEVTDALSGAPNAEDMAADTGRTPDGALDLLLEGEGWVLGLEAKVASGLHSNQLRTYREALEIGAGKSQRILVFLNQDPDLEPDDSAWVHVTWQTAVIAPLQAILKGPYGRQSSAALQFITSYLDVLEDQCAESGGVRERLLSEIVEDHDEALGKICGRSAEKLPNDVRELVYANTNLFRQLSRRYRSPSQRRLPTLKEFIDTLDGVTPTRSSMSVLRFTPTEWLKYEWLSDERRDYPSVVIELINHRDSGYRFKLMITDLGHEQYKDSANFAQRTALHRAAQLHQDRDVLFASTIYATGLTRTPDASYAAITLTPWQLGPMSETLDAIRQTYNSAFRPSVEALTRLIATIP